VKKQVTKLKAFIQLAAVLSVVGFHSIAQAQVVQLGVNESQTKLTVTSPGSCSRANANGCVRVTGRAQISFNLTGPSNCSLLHVALGNSENSQGGLSAVAASDFNANPSTGVVTPVGNPTARHIMIQDNNTAEYEVWYTVYASCGGSTITSDPRIENDGTGR
jgi:hypothetical protein